jgi:hypothetical protein
LTDTVLEDEYEDSELDPLALVGIDDEAGE